MNTKAKRRNFAIERVRVMAARPEMWAASSDGFLMQVWLLLEIAGVEIETIRSMAVRITGNKMDVAPLTKTFAAKVSHEALQVLGAS